MRQVVVNGVDVPSEHKITIAPGLPPSVAPIEPADRRQIGQDLAAAGQPAVAAAAPEPGMARTDESSAMLNLPQAPAEIAGLSVNDMATPALPPLMPTSGHVTGSLTSTLLINAPSWSGDFAFDVNLGSGSIRNASMNLSGRLGQDPDGGGLLPQPTSIDLHGGSGSVSGSNFSISGFSGVTDWRGMSIPEQPFNMDISSDPWKGPYAAMNGTVSRSGANVSVSGNYIINAPGSWSGPPVAARTGDRGTFRGSGQLQ
jgi:hypothetical protein